MKDNLITVYELSEYSVEIRNKKDIHEGCTLEASDTDPRHIAEYDTEAEALEALKKYRSHVKYYAWAVPFYEVTEYVVTECHYSIDEDGERFLEYDGGSWIAEYEDPA